MPGKRRSVPSYEQVQREVRGERPEPQSNREATIVDEAYGAIRLKFQDNSTGQSNHADAVSFWVDSSWMLRGGNRTHDVGYYEDRIESMEGTQIRGWVASGPRNIQGRWYTATLETDPDRIYEAAIDKPDYTTSSEAPGS